MPVWQCMIYQLWCGVRCELALVQVDLLPNMHLYKVNKSKMVEKGLILSFNFYQKTNNFFNYICIIEKTFTIYVHNRGEFQSLIASNNELKSA